MEESFPDTFQSVISERMGIIYNRNDRYLQTLKKEEELEKRLREALTSEQMKIVEEYHAIVCKTAGICELLAYRQGMRDMVSILTER